MKIKLSYFLSSGLILSGLFTLASCSTDDNLSGYDGSFNEEIYFLSRINEDAIVKTRQLDTLDVTTAPFNGYFYIESSSADNTSGEPIIGIYRVPSGYQSTLEPIDEENRLKWQSLRTPHTFHTWTLPWFDTQTIDESGSYVETQPKWSSSDWTSASGVSTEPCTIYFKDSPEGENGYDIYNNNSVYETFVGTIAGPYDYINHGKYVELIYRHLVSKISVEGLSILKGDNSVDEDIVANITFMGMPTYATFYPHPDDTTAPYVAPPNDIDPDSGVTFFINNKANDSGNKNEFYICPELDFSNIGFKINVNNEEYSANGDYFGSFNDIEFIREDDDGLSAGDGSDSRVLHAGEMMKLKFQLIPGVGPGIAVVIEDWSTKDQKNATHYPNPGIYTSAQMEELLNLFKQFAADTTPIPDALLEYLELYGFIDEDGNYIFPLYDNVSVSTSILSILKPFIIDGLGHQLTMQTNKNNVFNGTPYYNIGPVRNVYISDPNGNNSIYIDSDGNIYTFNPETGMYDATGNSLPPLENNQYSYDVNPVTGEVIPSTFYK